MVGALTTCFSLQGKLLWNGNLPPNCNGSCQGPHQVLSEGMPDWTILSHTTFEGSGSSFTGTINSNQGYLHGKSMENINLEARTFWIETSWNGILCMTYRWFCLMASFWIGKPFCSQTAAPVGHGSFRTSEWGRWHGCEGQNWKSIHYFCISLTLSLWTL